MSESVLREENLLPGEALPKSRRFTGSLPLKVLAFLLVPVLSLLAAAAVFAGVLMADYGVYDRETTQVRDVLYGEIAREDGQIIGYNVCRGDWKYAEEYIAERNIAAVLILDEGGAQVWRGGEGYLDTPWLYTTQMGWDGSLVAEKALPHGPYIIRVGLDETFAKDDAYARADRMVDIGYALRYWVWVIAAACAVLALGCGVFLLCAAGWRKGAVAVRPGWGTKIPFDLLAAAAALAGFGLLEFGLEIYCFRFDGSAMGLVFAALSAAAAEVLAMGWAMSAAVRVKLGGWWKNTLLWRFGRLVWRGLRKAGGAAGRFFRWLLAALPLVWKALLIVGGLWLLELLMILLCWWETDVLLALWVLEKILLTPLVVYAVLALRRLQRGGEALAAGNLSCQVSTRRLVGDLRRHAENLNSIGDGMARAVEQRMRSERLKTELITNVSHDIKTPLTSIVNYAELIGREPPGSEKTTEYAGVLLRQAERLKKLIEDLVEASKASTGNLEVHLTPCEAGVLLTQAAGEYSRRLEDRKLTMVLRIPEEPVTILADGRRLWRVLDNLMNNICKYALEGTRVYLLLERQGGEAVISFKNTSAQPLEQSADELLERFVRGDASRTSEGSGLGLSIARSLTELQKGKLTLTVDGDLFKVVLRFPVREETGKGQP
ncbi:sensor histidine kinase [Dysosmobacter sp.]|uniref:sensor histidine kinase n=1 Tax=Dysosmobacter sp. TaxID=2591382 RepID=UPI002A888838|nr:HAMP domain-containing sensor histidine kinase [Dysosmobacter sp.]MDY3282625.1 HAMP domain-containing sensor histidine kinase [Dysosmobacter sp.]